MRATWTTIGLAALVAAAASGCCCGLGRELTPEERAAAEERRAAEEAERQAARENAPARAQRLPGVASLIDPSAAVPEQACPEETLRSNLNASILRATIPTASYRSLADPSGEEEGWRWLDHAVVGHWHRIRANEPDLAESLLESAGNAGSRYLVVFVHQDRALPAITRDDGIIRAGQYSEGYYEGGLYVVDLDESRVVCSAPFTAESSDRVDGDDDFEEALSDDFRERFEEAADAANDRISDHIMFNVHGLF